MPSGLSQSHQEIAGQFQWELLQLTCLARGSGADNMYSARRHGRQPGEQGDPHWH